MYTDTVKGIAQSAVLVSGGIILGIRGYLICRGERERHDVNVNSEFFMLMFCMDYKKVANHGRKIT